MTQRKAMVWLRTRTVVYIEAFPVEATEEEVNQKGAFEALGLKTPLVQYVLDDRSTYCTSIIDGDLASANMQKYLKTNGIKAPTKKPAGKR